MVNPQQHTGVGTQSSSAEQSSAQQLKDDASSLADNARSEAQDKVEDLRGTAADKVDTLAEGIQAAASKFEGDDIGHMSEYVTELAESLGRLSSSMRDKSGDELLKEVTRLARDNPALFVTGSIAVGFGLARFAKASTSHSGSSSQARSAENASGTGGSKASSSSAGTASTPAGTEAASSNRPGVAYGAHASTPMGTSNDPASQAGNQHTGPRP